jgi:hypothetical protein
VGKKTEHYPIRGKHSLHQKSNENGIRLTQLDTAHEMTIGSTLFPHKDIQKATQKSPDGAIYNKLDHLL